MHKSPASFIDELQAQGRYTFTKKDLSAYLGTSEYSIKSACHRLSQKGRICLIKRGFYVVVPPEYRNSGIIPASWFIDDLMKYLKRPYYVGCLSAAAHHGASHQQPQVFHVVTDQPIRDIDVRGLRISFFMKSSMRKSATVQIKTSTGFMNVSDPAVTALDLVQFEQRVGGLNRVAEVLEELSEKIDVKLLLSAAKAESKLTYVQRLGFILDQLNQSDIADPLAAWLKKKSPRVTLLKPGKTKKEKTKDHRWNLFPNAELEINL